VDYKDYTLYCSQTSTTIIVLFVFRDLN